ncbi:hypothetical protein A3C91_04860 [Candidatus Azambacteria bacterium RIFCSPHIGHO2_02_FULL_52_12]|uniref:PD-(D/E)XK endonuclease-like domain-containing protein n=1 Tax=Candidatus Azambacteria bacterium RIFCSPLOWO2_01_FULL_46_25 TaxID=1797298 RepID=A0A1F5BVT1_9BACT|nr:MAG: hypothetical protein A3C91_04860 [Candidatus Azambacteria bacterium RIFCSPHIGHO2_02_FULL_52_12]OGD34724.1 MAG: hypothetical protein A2988_04475 [Candidatus Azambacteria bacterium RIFCSPLOWO2_01_FULL_46_25]OGD37003.1 MAG: hypothetical protein A2850_03740 [Candidatus Azambacteria bacterium RIFCSPHIGHO2_01_FULL_51_74]
MKTSYSALETFKQCPQKYKFQELDRIKVPRSKEALFGTLVHSALKFLHDKEPKFPSKEELLAFYEKNWLSEAKAAWSDEYEERVYKDQGANMLSEYYDRLDKAKSNVVDLELSFSVLLEDAAGEQHIVKGKIDRIDKLQDGAFEIIDYKTNRKMPSQDSVDNNLQLSIYHLALTSRWPNLNPEEVRLSLYFLKHNEKLSTTRNAGQLAQTKADILATIQQVKKSDFSPAPSKLCDYCGYRPLCPVWKHEYAVKEHPQDNETIRAVVAEYAALKAGTQQNEKRIEELKKIIGDFCDAQGVERVFGDGNYVSRKLQKRYAYDIAKIKAILEPLNLWNEIADIDGKKLAEIAKALPLHTQKEIEQAKKVESEYKVFSVAKKNN